MSRGTQVGTEPKRSARLAGLHYADTGRPGILRRHAGSGFVYQSARGRRITDRATLARIRHLAIPPAWRDVWISPDPLGHVQATGRDLRGRKQYRYHARWTRERDGAKFGRMSAFGRALPAIRRRMNADLHGPPLSRARVLATVVRLLEITLIRVGNEEYARANHSFGLTTLRDRHVSVRGSIIKFRFRAKSGVAQSVDLENAALARSVRRCQELPGQILFQYLDRDGRRQTVGSRDVNAYLREVTGEDFSAKDFRTWSGTVLAARELSEIARATGRKASQRGVVQAVERVAARLGNTRAVCRKCYVHPAVVEAYLAGVTIAPAPASPTTAGTRLNHDEARVLALLEGRTGSTRRVARSGGGRASRKAA